MESNESIQIAIYIMNKYLYAIKTKLILMIYITLSTQYNTVRTCSNTCKIGDMLYKYDSYLIHNPK